MYINKITKDTVDTLHFQGISLSRHPSTEVLDSLGYAEVVIEEPPELGTAAFATLGPIIESNGVWTQTWEVTEI